MKKLLTMLSILTITTIIVPSIVAFKIEKNSYKLKSALRQSNQESISKTNEKTDVDKIKDAIEELNKIEDEEVEVSSCFRNNMRMYSLVRDVRKAVKTLTKYTEAIKEVTLKKDLILIKTDSSILIPFDYVKFGDVITVKGKVQSGIEKKKLLNLLLK